MRRSLIVALAAPALLTGCVPSGQPEALRAGNAFQTALSSHDGAAACDLLSAEARANLESASARPCPEVLTSGVVFLARFRTGWKVTAAGCTPRPDQPYDCTVAG